MKFQKIFAMLVWVFILITAVQAQTEKKFDANDAESLKAAVKAAAKSNSVETAGPVDEYAVNAPARVKPTPTPDPADAAPAKPPSNGSNPAELITRVEMKYQFQNFAGGYLHALPVIRADYAITPAVSFRFDLPIMAFDPKSPTGKTESGIGDVVLSMTFVKPVSKKLVLAFVPLFSLPTATHDSLGSGKYAFKPLFAMVTPIAKWGGFVQVVEYRKSFAGKSSRSGINELSLKPIILKSFTKGSMKGFYINPKAEFIVDFEHNNNVTAQAGFEFGKAINKNVVVFATPTAHVAGTKRESFKFEVGFRYLFR